MKTETINSLIKALIDLFNNANEVIISEDTWVDNTAFFKLKKKKDRFFVCTTLQVSYDDGIRTNRLTVNEETMKPIGGNYKGSYKVTVPIVEKLEITDDQAETLLDAMKRLEKEADKERDRIVLDFIERITD